ncbi:MAG: hypothetical protein R3F42_01300 [Pseudomonadota bacterium]
MRGTSPAVLLCALLFLCPARAEVTATAAVDPLSPAYLEATGARIGEILIDNGDIFNPEDPKENRLLYRAANRLHIRTMPHVIRRQLLFRSGDVYSQRLLEESERILRSNAYLENARIEPVRYADGVVDLRVKTTDVWTLKPRLDFGRNGGTNSGTIGFEESNLLGTGISLSLRHQADVDSESDMIEYYDREVGGTRYSLLASYADSDEGSGYQFDAGLPFYALDSRHAHGLSLHSSNGVDTLYDRGEQQAEFRHEEDGYQVHVGFSPGLKSGWVMRYSAGFGFEEHRFSPDGNSTLPQAGVLPEDRKYVFPFVGLEVIEDDYAVVVNRDQIGRVEDILRGLQLNLQLGFASTAFGSLDNAVLLDSTVSRGFGNPGENALYLAAGLGGRWQDGGAQNLLLDTSASWYYRHSPRRMFFSKVAASAGTNLDLDNPLYLGGDSGLRGYPLRYQGGDRSLLLTIEERYFTRWYPWNLFRIGGAVFADVGRTWGENPVGADNLGWLSDVGFGLRIGNNRTGSGKVIHVDLAFPLDRTDSIDSVQLLLEAKTTF